MKPESPPKACNRNVDRLPSLNGERVDMQDKKTRIIVFCALGFVFFIFLCTVINIVTEDEPSKEDKVSVLAFLDNFTEYGYSAEQIEDMRTLLTNVGITEITELEIGNIVSGMQVVKGVIYKDPVYQYTGKEVQVQFNIENGKIYLVAIYCPSYNTSNQPTYLSGLTNRRADLYYDVEGGYLKKIDWENKAVVDY